MGRKESNQTKQKRYKRGMTYRLSSTIPWTPRFMVDMQALRHRSAHSRSAQRLSGLLFIFGENYNVAI